MNLSIQQIVPEDVALMEALLVTFGEAFDQVETYGNPPSADYLRQLLDTDYFIALAALKEGEVVGGLTAYELKSSSKSAVRFTSTISLLPPHTDGRGSQRH